MTSDEHPYLLDALAAIDPATLDYQAWVSCGMALHKSGYSWQDWEDWSRRDPARFHEGECASKWQTFGRGESGYDMVGSGTIIHLAEQRGWRQPTQGLGSALDWDGMGTATSGPDVTAADSEWFDDSDNGRWDPCKQLADWLSALFDDDDYVCITAHSSPEKGPGDKISWKPRGGDSSRTAGEIRRELLKLDATMDKVIGDWEEQAGAWACFNPIKANSDGRRSNDNISEYRYTLVESDILDVDRQLPAIKELHLPCATVTSSGGKSVHAIVRIDAKDKSEYDKRVRWLYDYCGRHGFVVDNNNKNAARLTRIPGVTRSGKRQLLLATNIGEPDWDSWYKWAEESEDDLPDAESGDWDAPIHLKPDLIGMGDECILRQGAKLIVVGDSKMGKSYTLIDLAEAICVGGEWLGMQCDEGKVFYINLEIDPDEFRWRQHEVWKERPESIDNASVPKINRNFVRWNLRGHATNMDKLAPRLVRRVLQYGEPGTFKAIIIDPIYKVNGGDDNDAKAVAKFTNTLDLIIQCCGCAVIYAHHHPKGTTGDRKSIDRMSGSGVYGRDADTVIDFSPLFVPEDIQASYGDATLFRAEISNRSFGKKNPIDCIFSWPRFRRDTSGKLSKLKILGKDKNHERDASSAEAREEQAGEVRNQAKQLMRDAIRACAEDDSIQRENPTSEEIFNHMPTDIRDGKQKVGGKRVTLNRVKQWSKKSASGFLGPFHNVNVNGVWVVIDDKTS